MYILVNENKVIIASSTGKPSEEICSEKGIRIYELDDSEYSAEMIGNKLDDFEIVETRIE
jgi:hypothetical protein